MGWKNVKDHYRIEHHVHVTELGICIGSPYVPDLIVISKDGQLVKRDDSWHRNADLARYMNEMDADPSLLQRLVQSPDTFTRSPIPVYTWVGGDILEMQCDEPGWPNVTHDGVMMYENLYSTDREMVIKWAKLDAKLSVKFAQEGITRAQEELSAMQAELSKALACKATLDAQFPDGSPDGCDPGIQKEAGVLP